MTGLIQDPEDPSKYIVANAAEPILGVQVGEQVLVNVHSARLCAGRTCVIHNPSDHGMRDWPLNWRGDIGLFERLCSHGVGHPDPDAVAYKENELGLEGFGVHGCDGCCRA
jgi:hypothetical protein